MLPPIGLSGQDLKISALVPPGTTSTTGPSTALQLARSTTGRSATTPVMTMLPRPPMSPATRAVKTLIARNSRFARGYFDDTLKWVSCSPPRDKSFGERQKFLVPGTPVVVQTFVPGVQRGLAESINAKPPPPPDKPKELLEELRPGSRGSRIGGEDEQRRPRSPSIVSRSLGVPLATTAAVAAEGEAAPPASATDHEGEVSKADDGSGVPLHLQIERRKRERDIRSCGEFRFLRGVLKEYRTGASSLRGGYRDGGGESAGRGGLWVVVLDDREDEEGSSAVSSSDAEAEEPVEWWRTGTRREVVVRANYIFPRKSSARTRTNEKTSGNTPVLPREDEPPSSWQDPELFSSATALEIRQKAEEDPFPPAPPDQHSSKNEDPFPPAPDRSSKSLQERREPPPDEDDPERPPSSPYSPGHPHAAVRARSKHLGLRAGLSREKPDPTSPRLVENDGDLGVARGQIRGQVRGGTPAPAGDTMEEEAVDGMFYAHLDKCM